MKRIAVILLLAGWPLGTVTALGLGEAGVRSSLGQALHAVVDLVDVPAEWSVDCFRLSPISTTQAIPGDTQLALVRQADRVELHIRTAEGVREPIVQFVLGTECGIRMQREYALLIDPPEWLPAAEPASPVTATDAPPATAQARPSSARVGRLPAARPTPVAASATVRPRPVEHAPRLVLSGKRRFADGGTGLALRFDTTLPDLARARATQEALAPTELSDENTALTRKLAHLETQLTELHQRNAELEARAQAAPPQPPQASGPARWPLALLLSGLLVAVAALFIWMRRRARPVATTTFAEEPDWAKANDFVPAAPDAMPAPDGLTYTPSSRAPSPPLSEDSGTGTELKEDILDQAEVFMAHGHGDFAVHLLQEHLRATPTESPVPWLLLLDLLHRAGDTAGYAAASTECRRHFNIDLSGHPISQDGNEPGPGLEAYPHVLGKLVAVWHTDEADQFFRDLIYDDRGGTRTGFEPAAYRDILMLREIAGLPLSLAA